MRHNKNFNHLGRKTAHRRAMLSNMACSLIEHKRITTTVAKAKALRQFVEPLVTRSKEDTTHSRRVAFSVLGNKIAVTELFRSVGPKVASRDGGYTRIIRTGNRLGDNAEMCLIELVDFNDIYGTDQKKKRSRRSRRGGSGAGTSDPVAPTVAAAEAVEAAAAVETAEEAVVVDEASEAPVEEAVEAVAEVEAVEEVAADVEAAVEAEAAVVAEDVVAEEAVAEEAVADDESNEAEASDADAADEEKKD